MRRKFEDTLIKWKQEGMKKPMMVVGVRQIGKTYTIDKFARENFKNCIYINLLDRKDIVELYKENIATSDKINKLEWLLNTKLTGEDTILFVDEVQESEEFISSLKYMCESDIKYNVIVAGSLLGVKINRFHSSFPVGKIFIEYMYPMDFPEFLTAIGKEDIIKHIKYCYDNNNKMEDVIHLKLMELYRLYLCVGGMPEAVLNLIDANLDIMKFDKNILKLIIDMYIADMNKYVYNNSESIKIEKVYRNISYQLAKENKKFQYSTIDKMDNSNKRKYGSALEWLVSSNMIYMCNHVKTIDIPLKVYQEENVFKIYMSDVGLLSSISEVLFNDIMLDVDFRFKGAIVENYVAQTFKSNNTSLNYWTSSNEAEVDFLITNDDGVIPIEVKSGSNTKSRSLNVYVDKFKPKYAIRISSKNFGFENNIKSVPLYAVFCIK